MERKYQLLKDDSIEVDGHKLYRIQALKDIRDNVRAGDLGGYIESEQNLAHVGDAWLYDTSTAYDHAEVLGNATLVHGAVARDHASISGAAILDQSIAFEHGRLTGSAQVESLSFVRGHGSVYGNAIVKDQSTVGDSARVYGHAEVKGARILANARVEGYARLAYGIFEGTVHISGNTDISSEVARVLSDRDVRTFDGIPGLGRALCAYRTGEDGVEISLVTNDHPKVRFVGSPAEFRGYLGMKLGSGPEAAGGYYLGLAGLIEQWFAQTADA